MTWIGVLWPMMASACLTLAGIHVLVWSKDRTSWVNLLFSATALGSAGVTFSELGEMTARTPAEFGFAMRWGHLAVLLWFLSIPWFVRLYLGAGRAWLAWTICLLRSLTLLPNFLLGDSLNYRHIRSVHPIPFLGDFATVADGTPNPWMALGQVTTLLMFAFVVDAGIVTWRRGARRKAVIIAGSIAFFIIAGLSQALFVYWGNLQVPVVLSMPYLGLALVMAHELSRDVLRASQLVHELEASEAGLRESEERMSLAVEAADLGIWVRELPGDEIWLSDRARTLFDLAPGERLDFAAMVERLHPDDRDALRQAHAAAVADAGGSRYEMEYRLPLPGGSVRWIASHGRVERDGAGRPVRLRGASSDITAAKSAEQEMTQLRHEIAHAGRVSIMGQLASALAHEINQPLGAILRNAEAAELFLQQPSPDLEEIRAILSDIRKDDQRAGQVVDGMRGLLKRRSLDRRPLAMGELVKDVVALVRVDAASRHVKLHVAVPRDLPAVHGDRVHIQQVLLNLMLNGMDALGEADLAQRHVHVSAHSEDDRIVEVAVGDSGHGIPADVLAHVFDPFFTTKPHGMGVGLSISRTIVEAHGGRLWAENTKGGGAAFRFTLPVAEGSAA